MREADKCERDQLLFDTCWGECGRSLCRERVRLLAVVPAADWEPWMLWDLEDLREHPDDA